MIIRQATTQDQSNWNKFIKENETGTFLQSWEWADFMATQKEKIYRLVVENDNHWQAVVFLFVSKIKGNFKILYAPKGPVLSDNAPIKKTFELIMSEINKLAKQEKAIYFQCDPQTNNFQMLETYNYLGFEKSARDIQPRHTLILNLHKSTEELLNQMHPKTRYNIRLAEKKGVVIEIDNTKFKEFNELLKKTTDRQQITLFGEKYFKELLNLPFVNLYLAKYNGQYIAANIMIFWNHTATYLFGASDYEFRSIMAPHLLQWEAIKNAQKQNCWFYDFWGAAPPDATGREQNWFGFTKFKMGFSPNAEITEYLGTYENIYSPVIYGIYRFMRNLKS